MIYTNALMSAVILVGWLILVGTGILRRGEPMGKLALQGGCGSGSSACCGWWRRSRPRCAIAD
jgi:hypothetical protein